MRHINAGAGTAGRITAVLTAALTTAAFATAGGLLSACSSGPAPHDHKHDASDVGLDAGTATWPFALPAGFPAPRLPAQANLTPALAELGRHLFYDKRMSGNGTQSCASCHEQARAFTDGKVTSTGSTGEVLVRNASSLTNAAYNPSQTWANPLLTTLELQALVPIEATHPVELGVTGNEAEIYARLAAEPVYGPLFAAAFPGAPEPINKANIVAAIAAFERRMVSGNSRVDQYRAGKSDALTASEIRGSELFFTERLECQHCHGGFNFTIAVDHQGLATPAAFFFNNGMYNLGGTGDYPADNQGLWEFTRVAEDKGRFRPPTLRNIAVTAPYMHDGSLATLEDVIRMYERGGRLTADGPLAGDGKTNPYKHAFVSGFVLTDQERADLIAYLGALTDEGFLSDPTLADPWQ